MDGYLYLDPENEHKILKKRARTEVNIIALASLISTALTYVFYIAIAYASPLLSRLLTDIVAGFGHSRLYASAFAESFVQSEELNWFLSSVGTILCSFVPFAIISRTMLGMKAEEAAPVSGKIMWSFPFIYCASLIMASFVSSVAGGLFAFLFPDASSQSAANITEIYGTSTGTASLILSFLSMCIVAPFAEEFIYRGVMFGHLKKFGVSFAAFSSSLIFGLGHAAVDQIAYAFIFGLVLCAVTEKTGNLKTAVIIHFINNFLGYFRTYLLPVMMSEEAGIIFETAYNIFVGVFALIGIIILFNGKKKLTSDELKEQMAKSVPISCFFGAGTVFVMVLAIINIISGLL